MKLIPRPEGFELRDKRSDKTGAGKDWEAADALYSAHQQMAERGCSSVVLIWTEPDPKGGANTVVRFAGETGAKVRLLIQAIGMEMGWNNKG